MRGCFTESERATVIHHCSSPLSAHELGLTIIITRNCNASYQCDNGLHGDSSNLLCVATTVAQVEITQCEQNLRVRYFCGYSLPTKIYHNK